ncbi:unnamed protein product [Medioppia subpectinata]|uniref:NR LBD domain-containing protein n=1 Tax=Medioppia subpectinata TaxID=1979941 RepID=A0A7R9L7B8_9ACAR|nr:unnamed protein product [Medioppia subpectinata]CAG2116678.1 unnamed protein product [Medioppia subpectinata]
MNRFKELFNSVALVRGKPVPPLTTIAYETESVSDGIQLMQNRANTKFTLIVKMSANIKGFNDLCEDDKIVLLKAGCPQLWLLQNIINFDIDGKFWRVFIGEEKATLLRTSVLEGWSDEVIQSHKNFMFSLNAEYNCDMSLIDLLSSIVLFDPDVPNLVHKTSIKLQQKTYMYLLQRYLEIKHNSKSESETRFKRLMNCLRALYPLTQLVRHHFGKALIHPIRVAPLVQEIFEI